MSLRVVTYEERPDLVDRFDSARLWPEFVHHDEVCNRHWPILYADFPGFQFALYDEANDAVVAKGNTIPTVWDGTSEGLLDGVDDVLAAAVALRDGKAEATALCAIVAGVEAGERGKGLSRRVLETMRDLAGRHGFADLIAPVRPTMKTLYPLAPLERYARWTRDDGLPFDPWIRVHHRLGAEILGIAPRSLFVEAPVRDWEEWTGMAFPESGEYVVEGALVPVRIDREADRGTYVEPNVWMRHAAAAG